MKNSFDEQKNKLLNMALIFQENDYTVDFVNLFMSLVDRVNLSLMEGNDDFYGYFLLQMQREINLTISGPTAVNFKGAKYIIYFNPIIFLRLELKQMESAIKHEILHIISRHIVRARQLKGKYYTLAINMSMDIVVNTYLCHLPSYATTLEWVNLNYALDLPPFETFEYYLDKIQGSLEVLRKEHGERESDKDDLQDLVSDYSAKKTHDLWMESDEIDEKTLQYFTKKYICVSQKGTVPAYLNTLISSIVSGKSELSWDLYLKRLIGIVESNKKKTSIRRNRRQPEWLDLKGDLKKYKAKIAVAFDISGSISDDEFKQAMTEVLKILKSYNHEITVIECDDEVRRIYQLKSIRDIKERCNSKGGTRFNPVFEYANSKKIDLLIYFTDGKGEECLRTMPKGYKVLWVITGGADSLSLNKPFGGIKTLKKIEEKQEVYDMSDVRNDGYSMNNQQPIL